VLLLGGLSSADASLPTIVRVRGGRGAPAGTLPVAQHDAAAAYLSGRTYFFGGVAPRARAGTSWRWTRTGGTRPAGSVLPVPASDVSAAVVDGTAYIVGGYTGSARSTTVVAFRPAPRCGWWPGSRIRCRYASVGAAGGRLIIAGGTSGVAAQRDILAFDPRSGRVSRIGRLPARSPTPPRRLWEAPSM